MTAKGVDKRSDRVASPRDSRATRLRDMLAALARIPPPSSEAVRHELEVLELQQVENAGALLRMPAAFKDRDPLSLARADELVTAYARERKQLLAEMYSGYLKLGARYDPSQHLRAIDDAAADFAAEAARLEGQVPGVGTLGQMLEVTSLKRPTFLDESYAGEDEGV